MYDLCSCVCNGSIMCNYWENKLLLSLTMTVHNYRSRQVHETLNGVHPSSNFRDMRSAKSGPNLWQISQVYGPWQWPTGKWPWQCTSRGLNDSTEPLNGENPSSGYRDMGSASLAAARPPARTVATIPLQPGGLRGKKGFPLQTFHGKYVSHLIQRQHMYTKHWLIRIISYQRLITVIYICHKCPDNPSSHMSSALDNDHISMISDHYQYVLHQLK